MIYIVKTSYDIDLLCTHLPDTINSQNLIKISFSHSSLYFLKLYLADLSDFEVLIDGNVAADKRQYTISGLVPFNSYQFRVYARNRFPQPGEYSRPSGKVFKHRIAMLSRCSCIYLEPSLLMNTSYM